MLAVKPTLGVPGQGRFPKKFDGSRSSSGWLSLWLAPVGIEDATQASYAAAAAAHRHLSRWIPPHGWVKGFGFKV